MSPLVGKAKLTNVLVGHGRTTGRQQEVAIALDKMIRADHLDTQPCALREHVLLTRDQAQPVPPLLGDHQPACLCRWLSSYHDNAIEMAGVFHRAWTGTVTRLVGT